VKILAIRFARLGDVILLLPALESLKAKFPGSELTFLTGHRCAPIAELSPAIDHTISVDRVAMRDGPAWRALGRMVSLVREIRASRFDLVVDFHSFRETNLLAWLSGAPARIAMKRHNAPYLRFCFNRPPVLEDKALHVAEMFQKVVAGIPSASGRGWREVPGEGGQETGLLRGAPKAANPTLVLYVDAPVPERIWPAERFAQVADFAIQQLGANVIVISSPERRGLAIQVQKASRNPDRLEVLADLTLPQLAAAISSAHLLISNDTGPMHLGPALGVQTLGLFSVGYPEHFRPYGPNDKFLRANPIERIDVRSVIAELNAMWAIAGPDPRR
jgi:heptosyltransferase I